LIREKLIITEYAKQRWSHFHKSNHAYRRKITFSVYPSRSELAVFQHPIFVFQAWLRSPLTMQTITVGSDKEPDGSRVIRITAIVKKGKIVKNR